VAHGGSDDSGRYFRYMAEFVGFRAADVEAIRRTKPIIEKYLPGVIARFYEQLLRYPPTRRFFLKKDGSVDHEYVELRMRHQTNFWLRTADGVYDDDYARYLDYVGRAHTSRGADPNIYIAERYVIGMVGFVQYAFMQALTKELADDEEFEDVAVGAWNKLLMVILEALARAYGHERTAETFEPLVPVDAEVMARLARRAFEIETETGEPVPLKEVAVGRAVEVADGGRKIVDLDGLSVGIFHHRGNWYAVENRCLHRGGPVATGSLEGDTLSCPWHGFQYDVTTGQMLVDPTAALAVFGLTERDGELYLQVPDLGASAPEPAASPELAENEFLACELAPGQTKLVRLDGRRVLVYNVDGTFYATDSECPHAYGPLEDGDLEGHVVVCPLHGSRFDVTTGAVVEGPADEPLQTFRLVVDGDIVRVANSS
jgi:nitrite reductase/ring-hydroxylating ferredoxin subunit